MRDPYERNVDILKESEMKKKGKSGKLEEFDSLIVILFNDFISTALVTST
jgi:hypothetical protein